MHSAPGVEDVPTGPVREDDDLPGQVLARPVGSALRRKRRCVAVDPERVQAAVGVENEAARAVGQEREIAGNVGTAPVMSGGSSCLGQTRRSKRMQSAEAVQDEA